MSQGNETPRSLAEKDPNVHPSRLQLLHVPEQDIDKKNNDGQQDFEFPTRRGGIGTVGGMKIRGRAEGGHDEDFGRHDDQGQRNEALPRPAQKRFGYDGTAYTRRGERGGQCGKVHELVEHGSEPREELERSGVAGVRRGREHETYRGGENLFANHFSRREVLEHNGRADGQRRRGGDSNNGAERREGPTYREYRDRGHQSDERETRTSRRRSTFNGRNEDLFANHRPRRSRSPQPYRGQRQAQESTSRRRHYSPHPSERRPSQRYSNTQTQARWQAQDGWWREDLSVEENFERGWNRVPREYRVFIRDCVSPAYRIVDDQLWRSSYSPIDNMEHFIDMIPETYREGFGEYLGAIERGNYGRC